MLSVCLLLLASAVSVASGLSCHELHTPSQNAVVSLGETPAGSDQCSGDLFMCSSVSQTCLNSGRRCAGGCDSEACLPFASLCDGVDDCKALSGGDEGSGSADEEHCLSILRTYRLTLGASIDNGRFMAFQVSLQTCAAYCFFHPSCSMFSYAASGGRSCKIGCDDCGWRTFTHQQSNANLYNATAATSLLRSRLQSAHPGTPSNPSEASPLPAPGTCGLRSISGPDTSHFELAVFGEDLGLPGFGPRLAAAADLRVVGLGGRRAAYGEYPWMAQLQVREGRYFEHHCGAVVVAERYVVTAAHCLEHARSMYQVVMGQFDRGQLDEQEQTFAIQEMILHPGFVNQAQASVGYPNDIAILKLLPRRDRGIVFSDKVQPLCITEPQPGAELPESCVVSGWGYTNPEGGLAEVLAGSPVPTVSRAFCESRHGYGDSFDGDIQVCAGNLTGGVDSCEGDSGGPLACYEAEAAEPHWYLAGIVSFGDGCGKPLKPGVYTRVAAFYDWIVRTLNYLESTGE
ncbi:transmembrane protease serine 2-like [Amphibalanus amphitrite]|uniref:transmembrane protease serine 2-like n=1 Tax=Amphibalanus amphitrite TaxID=1232801 RepID=UPI001C8FFD5B|nr:transmembrane protease serine 2-like [Amphibalanus amphitrite]